jgi:hypothetical protein
MRRGCLLAAASVECGYGRRMRCVWVVDMSVSVTVVKGLGKGEAVGGWLCLCVKCRGWYI